MDRPTTRRLVMPRPTHHVYPHYATHLDTVCWLRTLKDPPPVAVPEYRKRLATTCGIKECFKTNDARSMTLMLDERDTRYSYYVFDRMIRDAATHNFVESIEAFNRYYPVRRVIGRRGFHVKAVELNDAQQFLMEHVEVGTHSVTRDGVVIKAIHYADGLQTPESKPESKLESKPVT